MSALSRCFNIDDLRLEAKRRLPRGLFEYVDRGSEGEVSLKENRAAFDRLRMRPRVLEDVSGRSLETTLFGKPQSMPMAIAPMSPAGLLWHEGELALARAAAAAGIPYTLPTESMTVLERIASEAGGRLWFQLYLWENRDYSYYDVHPYLLLNHNDDYESLSTFAHEWGHAMHSVLAAKAQPFETANYPIFTAEIASTCNEQLLAAHMQKNARTKAEKLFYLDRVCELLRGTFFRQTMFAEFELRIHEAAEAGEALSGEKFSAIYLELLKRYHGPGVAIDPAYAIEWAYIPHFYYNFYVYQYATCVSAASYFAEKILAGGAAEREAYLGVLRAGGSDYPVDVLKTAGLDMTTPAPYRAVVEKLGRTIDQMEALL